MKHSLAAALILALACAPAKGQQAAAVCTFNNIGVEVILTSAPPAGTSVAMAVKENGAGDYRDAHPLCQNGERTFAGSVFQVEAGTPYLIRLSSTALASNLYLSVTTRVEMCASATTRTFHVALTGDDGNDGLSDVTAFRTVGRALTGLAPGDHILLHDGRFHEGDHDLYTAGTFSQPVVIEAAPGTHPVLDGTDTNFLPSWTVYDGPAAVFRTVTTLQPTSAFLNGGLLYRFPSLSDLVVTQWNQTVGYFADGSHLYVRFPDRAAPGTNVVTIPQFTYGLALYGSHIYLRGVEFCYYGYGSYPKGIYINGGDYNRIEDCGFHHNVVSVGIKNAAHFNLIQRSSFNEWPLDTWSWSAIKEGTGDYEAGGIYVFGSSQSNVGNVIRFNTFEHFFDGSHLYSDNTNGPTRNMDFHDNLIADCSDDAIETDGAAVNARFYNNRFIRFLTGISIAPAATGPSYIFRNILAGWHSVDEYEGYPFKFNYGPPPSTRWIYIYHNTCFTDVSGQDGFLFKGYSEWSNVVSRNNIYAGTDCAIESWPSTNPVTMDYDALFTTHATRFARWGSAGYATLPAFAAATGQETDGIAADPRFVDTSSTNYSLNSDSPLIDRGLRIPGINDDYVGAAPDIGAFEFVQSAAGFSAADLVPVVGWNTVSGSMYQLQFNTNLWSPDWVDQGTAATATNAYITSVGANQDPAGFYRLVLK